MHLFLSLIALRLFHLFEQLVGHHHGRPTLPLATRSYVEEGVVQRSSQRIVVTSVRFAASSTVVAYLLLTAVSGRLLLAALEVETEI